jgi:hypothetical protein
MLLLGLHLIFREKILIFLFFSYSTSYVGPQSLRGSFKFIRQNVYSFIELYDNGQDCGCNNVENLNI